MDPGGGPKDSPLAAGILISLVILIPFGCLNRKKIENIIKTLNFCFKRQYSIPIENETIQVTPNNFIITENNLF